jgi:hypothetical protein
MKRIVLLMVASFAFLFAKAQITQSESDSIVLQRMNNETRQHTIFAQKGVQTEFTIFTAKGEAIELDYPCWIYYVSYIEEANRNRYLIIKESNGNLLEVNTKNDVIPDDLAEWRSVKRIVIPFTEYSLDSVSCQWTNVASDTVIIINNNQELENYITCTGSSYPAVDFNQYSLLLVHGSANYDISTIAKSIKQDLLQEYELNIDIYLRDTVYTAIPQQWYVAIAVPKLAQNTVSLSMYYHEPKVLMLTVDYLSNAFKGGIEFMFSNNSDTFTISHQYKAPGDFGWLKLYYTEINEQLFYGTIIWMGCGQMYFPENLLTTDLFQRVGTFDYIFPRNGFENIFDNYDNGNYEPVWSSVQGLVKAREYLQSNPNQKVKIFLYAPSVGVGNPADAYWIIYLKK